MGGISIIGPMLFIAGVAAVVLVAVAIVQDLRHDKKYGYRQAFYTIVSLVMLVMTVAGLSSILSVTLKASVLPKADINNSFSFPPSYYRAVAPSCGKECLFSADDKLAFTQWKVDYQKWQKEQNPEVKGLSQQLRQDLAASLAILVVSVPLYILFSMWMNKGARQEFKQDKRPTPLRSVYFYGVSLAGLIMAVVAASMLLNIGFKMAFNTEDTLNNYRSAPSPVSMPTEKSTIQTVIDCAEKCSFTADDVTLAKEYLVDYDKFQKGGNYNSTQTDMANTLPLLILGIPLFWFHFARIRKETSIS